MKSIVILAAIIAITGCNQEQSKSQIDSEARAEIEQLKRQLSAIKLDYALQRIDLSSYGSESAYFDPQGTASYTKIKSPTGAVLVTLERIEPYLNGFNVFVKIGNPSTANLIGVSGEIRWGKSDEETDSMKSKKFDLTDTFYGGTWKTVKLTIGPSKTDEIQKIVFSPTFNQLSLAVRN